MRTVLVLVTLVGCRPRTPTYHRDVAPILQRHCRECHHAGGVAPVPTLDDYASARRYAQPIRIATQTRRMPPWGVDDTGLCGHWQDARWLSSDEIGTLAKWEQAGAPEGDKHETAAPARAEKSFRGDASVEIGGVYRPGLGPGGNRCFVADPGLDRDRLLSAIQVTSSDPRAVAQVTLFALDTPAADAQARALDDAEPGLGYSCFASPRVPESRLVASWSWPEPVLRFPSGTGVRLRAGRALVIQIHYDITVTSSSFQSDTRVALELDDRAREAQLLKVEAAGSLAPGQRYVAVEGSQPIARRLRVLGAAPRMHIRGDTLHLTVERAGAPRCLASFDHWHFNDQQLFVAASPISVEAGDRLRISCAYNTLGRAAPVKFGDLIDDEECAAWLYVTETD